MPRQGRVSAFDTQAPLRFMYPLARFGTASLSGSESVAVMPDGSKIFLRT